MSDLDRPVWASLATLHRPLSEGGDMARRYRRDINLFASARDDSDEALAALESLFRPGESGFVLQVPPICLPAGLRAVKQAEGVRMRFRGEAADAAGMAGIVPLGRPDVAEMLALTALTEPGPFLPRTCEMGRFWGIRIDGRLAAMAGERMQFAGFTELSGVCTHPDFRGRGLARRLSAFVTGRILDRRRQPFLHAWASNNAAIRLYEGLGYTIDCPVNVAVVTPAGI